MAFAALLLLGRPVSAGVVQLTWDGSSDPEVAGYLISYGTQPGVYRSTVDAGSVATVSLSLPAGSYYVVVQAYNVTGLLSAYSNEVTIAVTDGGGAATVFIGSVTPGSGPTTGGTSIRIYGTAFAAGMGVEVGGVAATQVTVVSSTELTARTPAHTSGAKDVRVSNGGQSFTLGRAFTYVVADTSDLDFDGLPDAWEMQYGLSTSSGLGDHGAAGDPDDDGATNAEEFAVGTHPRGVSTRYFAEGVNNDFFRTSLSILNPSNGPATSLLRFSRADGTNLSHLVTVAAHARATVQTRDLPGLGGTAFSTIIESDTTLAIDRLVSWGDDSYGAHAERAIEAPSTTWYLAEGATHSGFDLFYLVQNPGTSAAAVRVTYLLPSGAPLVKTYTVAPLSRFNIWVDREDQRLASTDVSAVIASTNGVPIIVERSMYMNTGGVVFGAGHNSAGVTAPATRWFLAEGATGPYFDLFVLIANPNTSTAQVRATYLLTTGQQVVRTYTVAPNSRFNIWVDREHAWLADAAVSTTVESTNGVPVIVERTMWWPGTAGSWLESHNSPGATSTGTSWAVASGESGGSGNIKTYVLIANTSAAAGSVRVTLMLEDGQTAERTFALAASSRFNVDVSAVFTQAAGKRFGVVVASVGATPLQLAVEAAMYWDAQGRTWAAGTNALATRLP